MRVKSVRSENGACGFSPRRVHWSPPMVVTIVASRAGLIAAHHDVGRIDDRIGLVAGRQSELLYGFIRDRRRNHRASWQFDSYMRRRCALLYLPDPAFEHITRTDSYGSCSSVGCPEGSHRMAVKARQGQKRQDVWSGPGPELPSSMDPSSRCAANSAVIDSRACSS